MLSRFRFGFIGVDCDWLTVDESFSFLRIKLNEDLVTCDFLLGMEILEFVLIAGNYSKDADELLNDYLV